MKGEVCIVDDSLGNGRNCDQEAICMSCSLKVNKKMTYKTGRNIARKIMLAIR